MRNVIASEMVSLDGYFAGPNGEIDWFVWNKDSEKYAIELANSVDTILFGRVTYEMMANYWPSASPPTDNAVIIDKMNSLPKIVFSRTLERPEWNNTRLIKENIAEEILRMKKQPGRDMVIYGSGRIVSFLLNHDLIDEMHLLVNPVVLGSGKPLFTNIAYRHKMSLVGTSSFGSGVVALHYSRMSEGTEL